MKRSLVALLIASLLLGANSSIASAVSAGSTCKKLGQIKTSLGKKYTCIKFGKKFIWKQGVENNKPTSQVPLPTEGSSCSEIGLKVFDNMTTLFISNANKIFGIKEKVRNKAKINLIAELLNKIPIKVNKNKTQLE